MSASTQTGEMNRPATSNGNGHTQRKTRGPNKAKAKTKPQGRPAAIPSQGVAAPIPPSVVAARRIGPTPAIAPAVRTAPVGTLAWLYERQAALAIEAGVIRSMIAAFRPGTSTAAVRTTKKRRKARRKAVPAQAAA